MGPQTPVSETGSGCIGSLGSGGFWKWRQWPKTLLGSQQSYDWPHEWRRGQRTLPPPTHEISKGAFLLLSSTWKAAAAWEPGSQVAEALWVEDDGKFSLLPCTHGASRGKGRPISKGYKVLDAS